MKWLSACIILVGIFSASQASAQWFGDWNEEEGATYSSTSSTTSTGITATVIVVVASKDEAAARRFIHEHATELQESVSVGAGPYLKELAFLLEIDDETLPQFAKTLRTHRHVILPALYAVDEDEGTAALQAFQRVRDEG